MGDFNMPVHEETYKLYEEDDYKSVGVMLNGKEFDKTFPSGI